LPRESAIPTKKKKGRVPKRVVAVLSKEKKKDLRTRGSTLAIVEREKGDYLIFAKGK